MDVSPHEPESCACANFATAASNILVYSITLNMELSRKYVDFFL